MSTYTRVRERAVGGDREITNHYATSAPWYVAPWSFTWLTPFYTAYQMIQDNPHHGPLHGRLPATVCDNVKVVLNQTAPLLSSFWSSSGRIDREETDISLSLDALKWFIGDTAARVSPDASLSRMKTRLMTQIPVEVELGNFLLEARESAELIPSLLQSWEKLSRMSKPRRLKDMLNGIERDPRRLDSVVADHALWWSFGVAPLLADIDRLATLRARVGSRLEQLRKWNGRTVNRRAGPWSVTSLPAVHPERSVETKWVYAVNYSVVAELTELTSELRANVRLDSALEGLDGWEGLTAAYLAATGLNNPIQVAFNAIPFSFVLDWFAPVGDRLARVGSQPIAGRWVLSDWTWSCKTQARWTLKHYAQTQSWNGPIEFIGNVGEIVVDLYHRDIVFPDFPYSWPLTAGQAGTALALALANA